MTADLIAAHKALIEAALAWASFHQHDEGEWEEDADLHRAIATLRAIDPTGSEMAAALDEARAKAVQHWLRLMKATAERDAARADLASDIEDDLRVRDYAAKVTAERDAARAELAAIKDAAIEAVRTIESPRDG